jgi:hypothetical protein
MSGFLKDLKREDGDASQALRKLVPGPTEAARILAKRFLMAMMSVDPTVVERVLKANPYHDNQGRFTTAEEDTTPEGPSTGKPFLIYRLGRAEKLSLDNKNAGNALGVSGYIASALDDYEKPPNSSGSGDTIHAFEVTTNAPFAPYSRMVGGAALDEAITGIGRTHKNGVVSYSFPKGGAWQAKHLGSVPLAEVPAAPEDDFGQPPQLCARGHHLIRSRRLGDGCTGHPGVFQEEGAQVQPIPR